MDKLLARSAEFEERMMEMLTYQQSHNSVNFQLSKLMCSISFEHGQSFKILLAAGNFTSAIGMLRLQFESFVRGVWICYAAKDSTLKKLTAELNDENVKRADDSFPSLGKMIEELESNAPKESVDPIKEFKQYSWKPLSSYIHGY